MLLRHKEHIERLSHEIMLYRHMLAEVEWQRSAFIKLSDKHRPATTPVQRWFRSVKRTIAFWLLQ